MSLPFLGIHNHLHCILFFSLLHPKKEDTSKLLTIGHYHFAPTLVLRDLYFFLIEIILELSGIMECFMSKKFFVTTPIYYPNAKPHIGTLYSTLLADIFARWNKLFGKEVFFSTGLDEHGQKIADAASSLKLDPQVFVDQMAKPFVDLWQEYNLDYSDFIRTTSQKHSNAVVKLFQQLIEKGFIYKASYSGYYCTPCEAFIAQGSCEDVTFCSIHKKPTQELLEENYFFKLSAFEDKLLKFYEENPTFIQPQNRINEVVSFVKAGLKDLSITRKTVKWGIPFPLDPEHTFYVWGDALTNYLSVIGYGSQNEQGSALFEKFWPADLQIIGKDIVRFHAVYWPAFLMAAELPLPKKLLVHGYILMADQKVSKSLGNAVDPVSLKQKFGVGAIRYYLAKQIAVTQDSPFSIDELVATYNADLANNFGNLINRITTLCCKNDLAEIQVQVPTLDVCKKLFSEVEKNLPKIIESIFEQNLLHHGIQQIMALCSEVNSLIHATEPWKLVKSDQASFKEVMSCSAQVMLLLSKLLWPFLPKQIETLWTTLEKEGIENNNFSNDFMVDAWQENFVLKTLSQPLFPRIEIIQEQESLLPEKQSPAKDETVENSIGIEDFCKVKLAAGLILFAENVANSDKLLRLEVDFGPLGKRQVVSGIALFYKPESIIGKKAIFVVNLAPRKIMGLASEAMILAAKDGSNFSITILENDQVAQGSILG